MNNLIAECLRRFQQVASQLDVMCPDDDLKHERVVNLVWAYAEELANAAKYHLYRIELPSIETAAEHLEELSKKEIPQGIMFDEFENATTKAELLNLEFNWSNPLAKSGLCALCKRYFVTRGPSCCPRCNNSRPAWYDQATKQCDAIDTTGNTYHALVKAWQVLCECGADDPNWWIHPRACEFKWPGAALYTFADKDSFFLLEKDDGFVSVDYVEFKVKFTG